MVVAEEAAEEAAAEMAVRLLIYHFHKAGLNQKNYLKVNAELRKPLLNFQISRFHWVYHFAIFPQECQDLFQMK